MDKYNYVKQPKIIKKLELKGSISKQLKTYSDIANQMNFLLSQSEQESAIKLLTFGLPNREAVWWSYLIVNQADIDKNDIKAHHTLRLVDDWVKAPTEDKRRLAQKSVDALTLFSPIAWVAQAVFMSGGSISPIGQFDVKPDEFACVECAATAIILTKLKSKTPDLEIKKIIRSGLHIAKGGNGKILV